MSFKRWGVFDVHDETGNLAEIHVAPCTEDGFVAKGHTLDISCPCISKIEDLGEGKPSIIVHEEIH